MPGERRMVSVSLAGYGMDACYVTKVPNNEIGQCAVNALRRYGVDTSRIIRGGERLGIYFVEKGASQRASKVIYDRAGSSIAQVVPGEFDWNGIFRGADWFHFTGITPALGEGPAAVCLEACKAAKAANVKVSCDLNYRGKLWTREQAGRVMAALMEYVDVCIANEEDAADVFGIHAAGSDVAKGKLDRDGYASVARQIAGRFGCRRVAVTLRESVSASDNNWSGMLFDGGNAYFAPAYSMHIVDRVGGGDSFGGALIYALLNEYESQKAIDFAVAASCLKHSIEHDYNLVTAGEVESLAAGNKTGRVQR